MPSSGGWFKSSYSSDSQACVEIRFDCGVVLVRDSKYQGPPDDQPILAVGHAEWSAFLTAVRAVAFPLA
jgi:hypothetical protein